MLLAFIQHIKKLIMFVASKSKNYEKNYTINHFVDVRCRIFSNKPTAYSDLLRV